MASLTYDSISLRGAGVVTIVQHKKGHRFTLDSLLLADFCRIKPRGRILEPGAGTGIISILLARKFPKALFVADEVEPSSYSLLCDNIERNGLLDRILPVNRDVKYLGRSIMPEAFDAIVANPPYIRSGTGRKSPSPERQMARQDLTASLHFWLNLQSLLKNKGRYFIVYHAGRLAELVALMRMRNIEPKRMRLVHPRADKPASLVLIEAVKSAGIGLDVLPPLVVHQTDGKYTEEMHRIYNLT
ncbi:MAG TPA: methyltransferase [Nitrospirota bacterium]|nr:methyltransferase [Nitrospirota bacterium]